MTEIEFLEKVRQRVAIVSVGASALRNQGAKDIIRNAREYFIDEINLIEFFTLLKDETLFLNYLDGHTDKLKDSFKDGGRHWGAARKGLNLFFRDITYNKFLAEYYGLPTGFIEHNDAIKFLEIPLDKDVGIRINALDLDLPRWHSIKALNKVESDLYQKAAGKHAKILGIAKVHLDLEFWRNQTPDNFSL